MPTKWDEKRDWARREAEDILTNFWDGTLPVDPIQIAKAQNIALYKAQIPGAVSGFIRKPKLHKSGNKSAEIVIDKDEIPVRARFTIAHELGHYRSHVQANGEKPIDHIDYRIHGETSPEEYGANEFAGALLMPEARFREAVKSGLSTAEIARKFEVSKAAVRVRREVLNLSETAMQ